MEREKLIEKAERYFKWQYDHGPLPVAEIMADFAIEVGTLNGGWVEIKDENDLPKVEEKYLWKYRNRETFDAPFYNPAFADKAFWAKTYSAWMPIPPFSPAPDGGESL